jgi:hypothetical protein
MDKPHRVQHEDILHKACVQWFGLQYGMRNDIFINHCPNENPKGDKFKMIRYNAKMKSMGRMTGFPDLEIGYKGKVLFIELKSESGRLSDNQKSAHQNIINAGFEVIVIRSLEEFMEKVNGFILHHSIETVKKAFVTTVQNKPITTYTHDKITGCFIV